MIQSLLNGLVQGALYAIIALGYTLVYGILLMINFAHGEVLMVGAYVGVIVVTGLVAGGLAATLGIVPALAVAILFAMVVAGSHGVLIERFAYRPLRKAHQLAPLISAIGMSIVLQNYVRLAQGSTPEYEPLNAPEYRAVFGARGLELLARSYTALDVLLVGGGLVVLAVLGAFLHRGMRRARPEARSTTVAATVVLAVAAVGLGVVVLGAMLSLHVGDPTKHVVEDVRVTPLDLFILVLCLALMAGLFLFISRTRMGKAMRATSQDRVMAGLVGIDTDRVITWTFAVGSMLAAVAGVLLTLYTGSAKFTMGFLPGMKAFTAAVLGGIGNVPGAMLGGIVLGLAEAAGIYFVSADYKEVYSLAILLLVLIARPRGILGERVAEKV